MSVSETRPQPLIHEVSMFILLPAQLGKKHDHKAAVVRACGKICDCKQKQKNDGYDVYETDDFFILFFH